jgi:hypothetical protein
MTGPRYIQTTTISATARPIGGRRTYDRSYEVKQGAAESVWSGKATCVQSFGMCLTPHIGNHAQQLVNGLCGLCRANME